MTDLMGDDLARFDRPRIPGLPSRTGTKPSLPGQDLQRGPAMSRRLLQLAALGAFGLLVACSEAGLMGRPPSGPQTAPPVAADGQSPELRRYYAAVEKRLLAQGLMRTDREVISAPVTVDRLVRDFIRIALKDEYTFRGGRFLQKENVSYLRRWQSPIRMTVIHGPSVAPGERAYDLAEIRRFTQRLTRLTGVPIRLVAPSERPNFLVLVLGAREQKTLGPRLVRQLLPVLGDSVIREMFSTPRSIFCAAYVTSAPEAPRGVYTHGAVIIKAEHPRLMRQSCIHEELAQSMGLPNDSPEARPSIFNDDEEFALLTRHDELLLRILYDPRLKPGMTAEEARPIVERIARELLANGV